MVEGEADVFPVKRHVPYLGAFVGAGMALSMGNAPSAFAQPQSPSGIDASLAPYASTQDSVRLPDGRTIHMVCMGKGNPVVVLTAGAGNWSNIWNRVQPAVAGKTRVCAWDRAGFGMSSPSPLPQTAENRTSDLQAALKAHRINGSYVVVGHSLGGYESLLLKDREPSKVVGMVLVDPSFPGQNAVFNRVAPALAAWYETHPSPAIRYLQKCAADLRSGAVKIDGGPDPQNCTHPPYARNLPSELRTALEKAQVRAGPETLAGIFETQAYYRSDRLLDVDAQITLKPGRNYGRMPLVVLTAGDADPPPPEGPPEAKAEQALYHIEWIHGHDDLAALSSRGVNHVVDGTTHYIQQLMPQVVIDAIDQVVDEARAPNR